MMKKLLSKITAAVMIAAAFSGFTVNADVENGNWLTDSQVEQMSEKIDIPEEENVVSLFGADDVQETADVKFYILKEGCKVPLDTEPAGNPIGNYVAAGVGTISKDLAVHMKTKADSVVDVDNGDMVEQNLISVPQLDLPDNLYVDWYVLKRENDGLHVDGCIKRKGEAVNIGSLKLSNAYIYGDAYTMAEDEDGNAVVSSITTMRPEGQITREEACALIGRILLQNGLYKKFQVPEYPTFNDIGIDQWSYKHIEYIANMGAFFNNKSVEPAAKITRGQFAEIMASALNLSDEAPDSVLQGFADYDSMVKSPYYAYAARLVNESILKGDNNDCINLNAKITRAEAVTAINRMIGRDSSYKLVTADGESYKNYYSFADMSEDAWYYNDMVRATSAYDKDKNIDPELRNQRDNLDDINVLSVK